LSGKRTFVQSAAVALTLPGVGSRLNARYE
jgi:hypothetical protein